MVSLQQKISAALCSAIIFLIVSLPQTYRLTEMILGGLTGPLMIAGRPTNMGLLVHSIVFYAITRIAMNFAYPAAMSSATKNKRALIAAGMFAVIHKIGESGMLFDCSPLGCSLIYAVLLVVFMST